jgi:hypothetical protein
VTSDLSPQVAPVGRGVPGRKAFFFNLPCAVFLKMSLVIRVSYFLTGGGAARADLMVVLRGRTGGSLAFAMTFGRTWLG